MPTETANIRCYFLLLICGHRQFFKYDLTDTNSNFIYLLCLLSIELHSYFIATQRKGQISIQFVTKSFLGTGYIRIWRYKNIVTNWLFKDVPVLSCLGTFTTFIEFAYSLSSMDMDMVLSCWWPSSYLPFPSLLICVLPVCIWYNLRGYSVDNCLMWTSELNCPVLGRPAHLNNSNKMYPHVHVHRYVLNA